MHFLNSELKGTQGKRRLKSICHSSCRIKHMHLPVDLQFNSYIKQNSKSFFSPFAIIRKWGLLQCRTAEVVIVPIFFNLQLWFISDGAVPSRHGPVTGVPWEFLTAICGMTGIYWAYVEYKYKLCSRNQQWRSVLSSLRRSVKSLRWEYRRSVQRRRWQVHFCNGNRNEFSSGHSGCGHVCAKELPARLVCWNKRKEECGHSRLNPEMPTTLYDKWEFSLLIFSRSLELCQ